MFGQREQMNEVGSLLSYVYFILSVNIARKSWVLSYESVKRKTSLLSSFDQIHLFFLENVSRLCEELQIYFSNNITSDQLHATITRGTLFIGSNSDLSAWVCFSTSIGGPSSYCYLAKETG
jgi:hypothetical protein